LALQFVVEIETHPAKADEYRFLTTEEVYRWAEDIPISPRFVTGSTAAKREAGSKDSSSRVSSFSHIR
jgi:hypothetical protein